MDHILKMSVFTEDLARTCGHLHTFYWEAQDCRKALQVEDTWNNARIYYCCADGIALGEEIQAARMEDAPNIFDT